MNSVQEQWRELMKTFKDFNKPKAVFPGLCPHCVSTKGFYQQVSKAIAHGSKLNGFKGFAEALGNPKKKLAAMAISYLKNPWGEPAHCYDCDQAVLRCPKCKHICKSASEVVCSKCSLLFICP